MEWISSINRYDATRDVLATSMITTMNTNDSRHHKNGHARIRGKPLLTHINEKKEASMMELECNNTTNVSFNKEEEDWDLVTNDQYCDKANRKHQMKMTLVDGGANGGIAGTDDSQPWDSNINS